jgi:adenosylmethionine-8-amino-7-oxononanoate aminotransferase
VRGEGCYLIDENGKRYLDSSGGAAVSCLGHGHPRIIEALEKQAEQIAYAHTSFFSNKPMEELADLLVARAPGDIEKAYFVSGGSEAIEASLKIARQYFVEIGQEQRRYFIARHQSYHGNTLGALAVGGNEWRRRQYDPLLIDAHHISPCFAYRGRRDDETEEQYGQRVADELEAKIAELGHDSVIAFVAETVVGATAGAVPPVPGYFKRIREICDRYGILLILDEVMCGTGRTGTYFACEQEEIAPDILVLAKGLGAGYQPIGAMLVGRHITDAIASGSGFFQHGHTYQGHAIACATALAVQKTIDEERLCDLVAKRGTELSQSLQDRFGNHRYVGDIRGRGLFFGIELVADRASKKPFAPSLRIHAQIKREAMSRGLLCYPMGGTIDGKSGDHVLIAPPYIINSEQIGELVYKLGDAIDAVTVAAKM